MQLQKPNNECISSFLVSVTSRVMVRNSCYILLVLTYSHQVWQHPSPGPAHPIPPGSWPAFVWLSLNHNFSGTENLFLCLNYTQRFLPFWVSWVATWKPVLSMWHRLCPLQRRLEVPYFLFCTSQGEGRLEPWGHC